MKLWKCGACTAHKHDVEWPTKYIMHPIKSTSYMQSVEPLTDV